MSEPAQAPYSITAISRLLKSVDRYRDAPEGGESAYRYGQAVFNVAAQRWPEQVSLLAGTEVDCFFLDWRVPAFLSKLQELGLLNG